MDIEDAPRDRAQAGRMRKQVGEARGDRAEARDFMDPREEAHVERAVVMLVELRKKLGLVSRHIDRRGALGLARLARKTKLKCFFKYRIAETVEQAVAAQGLPEQVSASARGMHLFARRHVRRT